MKRVKFIVASLLFCTMSYVGYTSYEGGKSLCYNSYTKADNNQILRCVSCDYVDGIGNGKTGYCKW